MAEALEVVARCAVCGGSDHERVAVPKQWIGKHIFAPIEQQLGLMRCGRCGLYFVNPRPGPELLASFYDDPGYDCHTTGYGLADSADARHRLDVLRAHVTHQRSLIDLGCGAGALMRAAIDSGWAEVAGVDVGSKLTARLGSEGLQVFPSLDAAARGRLVDAVTMIHVLEHLPDPAATLRSIDKVLAPGGLLMIEVPNVGSLRALIAGSPLGARVFPGAQRFQAYPIHLQYFAAAQLARLVHQLGYTIVDSRTSGMGIDELKRPSPPNDNGQPTTASAGWTSSPSSRKQFVVLRRVVKAFMSRAGLGEHLLCVWRKPATG